MRHTLIPLTALAFSLSTVFACNKAEPGGAIPTAATPAPPAVAPPIAPRIEGPVGALLDNYEKMRAALAADDVATALTAAQPLADAATQAGATWTAVATVAGKIAAEKPDLKATRLKFADISKVVVTVLVADPKLREGRFIFECPMAPAYQRWVQTTPALRNPYYGSEMLECGSQVDWKSLTDALVPLLGQLFAVLGVGLLLRRVLPGKAPHWINRFVIDALMPALLLMALARARVDFGGAPVLVGTSAAQALCCVLAIVAAGRLGLARQGQGSAAMTTTFANTGFLGFPVVLALFGADARASSTALLVDGVNTTVFLWSVGVLIAARYGSGRPFSARGLVRALVRPMTVCIAIGLVLSFNGVVVPAGTDRAVEVLGALTSGLVFFALGLSLDLPALRGRLRPLLACAGLKLLVMPAVVLAVVWAMGIDKTAGTVAVLQCAMPSAMVSVIISTEEGCDRSVAAGVAALTTLCCVLTLPLVAWWTGRVLG